MRTATPLALIVDADAIKFHNHMSCILLQAGVLQGVPSRTGTISSVLALA